MSAVLVADRGQEQGFQVKGSKLAPSDWLGSKSALAAWGLLGMSGLSDFSL